MEENINIDPGQIEKILSMVKLMNNINSANNVVDENENKNLPSAEVVEKMDGNTALRRIKEAVPFLDFPYQRNIGLMIKIMEIDKLVNNFRAMSVSGDNGNKMKRQMLLAIRPELDGRKQKMLDVFVRVMEITDIMEGLGNNE
ncbi:MAG: hypothetical protein Q4F63_03370 [Clostridia bacterium]|nr:hypothetical protein [Clostridia bacterium]